jgi:hypothetical protein
MFTTIAPFTLRAVIVGVPLASALPNTVEQGGPAHRVGLDVADGVPTIWPVAGLTVTIPAILELAFRSVLKLRLSPSKPPPKLSNGAKDRKWTLTLPPCQPAPPWDVSSSQPLEQILPRDQHSSDYDRSDQKNQPCRFDEVTDRS